MHEDILQIALLLAEGDDGQAAADHPGQQGAERGVVAAEVQTQGVAIRMAIRVVIRVATRVAIGRRRVRPRADDGDDAGLAPQPGVGLSQIGRARQQPHSDRPVATQAAEHLGHAAAGYQMAVLEDADAGTDVGHL